MNPKRNILKIIILFLLALFIPFMAWSMLRGRSSKSEPSPPTAAQNPYGDFKVQIPDKALIKNYLTVSLETAPGTACKLTFIPPSGAVREMETTADANGFCEWRWKIEENDGRGHGRLIFTVNGVSDTHFIEIRPGF